MPCTSISNIWVSDFNEECRPTSHNISVTPRSKKFEAEIMKVDAKLLGK